MATTRLESRVFPWPIPRAWALKTFATGYGVGDAGQRGRTHILLEAVDETNPREAYTLEIKAEGHDAQADIEVCMYVGGARVIARLSQFPEEQTIGARPQKKTLCEIVLDAQSVFVRQGVLSGTPTHEVVIPSASLT